MVQSWPEDKKSIIISQPLSSEKVFLARMFHELSGLREEWDERHANQWGKNE
jgi:hypothetical protein